MTPSWEGGAAEGLPGRSEEEEGEVAGMGWLGRAGKTRISCNRGTKRKLWLKSMSLGSRGSGMG